MNCIVKHNKWEWDENNPENIYDGNTDLFCPLLRRMGAGGWLYQHPANGQLVGVNKMYAPDNPEWKIDIKTKHVKHWYGTETVLAGYIVETNYSSVANIRDWIERQVDLSEIEWISHDKNMDKWPMWQQIKVYATRGNNEGYLVHVDISSIGGYHCADVILIKHFMGWEYSFKKVQELTLLLQE